MTLLHLAPLSAAIFNCLLAIFVLSRGFRSTPNRVFFLWGMCITVWNLGTYFMFTAAQPDEAYFWARFLQLGVIFIPVTVYHLSLLIVQIRNTRILPLLYGFSILLCILNLSGQFVTGVVNVGYAYYSQAGWGFYVFAPYMFCMIVYSVYILWKGRRLLEKPHSKKLDLLIIAQTCLLVFGVNDVLPIFAFHHYPLTNVNVYPWGSIAAVFYGVMISYCVLQHQLLNIHISMGRIAATIVRLFFLLSFAFLLLILASFLAPDQFTPFSFVAFLFILTASASVTAVLFPKLLGTGSEKLERKLLGDQFEYQDKINGFIESIPFYSDSNQLMEDLETLLSNTLNIERFQILLLNEKTRSYFLYHQYPKSGDFRDHEIPEDSALPRFFRHPSRRFLAFNLAYTFPSEDAAYNRAKKQLEAFQPEFCFPFLTGEILFGFLVLGPKTGNTAFTGKDLDLVLDLVKSLSLVINQIRLKSQIDLAHELELLGTMSRGLAHDLNNLITPIFTYFQIRNERNRTHPDSGELLRIAFKNTDTIRAYIKEALFFSNTHSLNLKETTIGQEIDEAVDVCYSNLQERRISVSKSIQDGLDLRADDVLLQRLLVNLIQNAIDASEDEQQIVISARRITDFRQSRNWFRIKVIDEGSGIPKEILNRIFTPYFTTKDLGDKTRGFGLGLCICRKIVHLHQGTITVFSTEGEGTTVEVDLPSHPVSEKKQSRLTTHANPLGHIS